MTGIFIVFLLLVAGVAAVPVVHAIRVARRMDRQLVEATRELAVSIVEQKKETLPLVEAVQARYERHIGSKSIDLKDMAAEARAAFTEAPTKPGDEPKGEP